MTASAATTRMYVCALDTDVLRLDTLFCRVIMSPARGERLLTVVCIADTSLVRVVMLEDMELILVEIVLTVLEIVLTVVVREPTAV